MRKCPYCAEEIQDEAIKCKHCGEMLNTKKDTPKRIAIICPKCLKEYVASWKMCFNCNVPLIKKEVELDKKKLPIGKYSCPVCHSKHTKCEKQIGCVVLIIIFISLGLGLIMIPFLPYHCVCLECGHKWKT